MTTSMTHQPSQQDIHARLNSPGNYGTHGSATRHQRYSEPTPPRWRRKCRCGCGGKTSHAGRANGVTLTSGCELSIRRWVRDGTT